MACWGIGLLKRPGKRITGAIGIMLIVPGFWIALGSIAADPPSLAPIHRSTSVIAHESLRGGPRQPKGSFEVDPPIHGSVTHGGAMQVLRGDHAGL